LSVNVSKKGNIDFTKGSIIQNMILFSVPIVLGELFQNFYNSVDADDHFPFRDGGAPPAVSGDRHAASADRIYLRRFPPGMGSDGVHAYDPVRGQIREKITAEKPPE